MNTNSRLHRIYMHMKQRCYNPKNNRYKNYGARGITVCDEWLNKKTIPNNKRTSKGWIAFREWALSHGYTDELTIDRINVNKGYSPENCRWITNKEQCNNRRSNHLVTYKGETRNLTEWCEILGLNYDRVERRINKCKWSVDKAFETACFVPKHNFKEMTKQELSNYYHNNYMNSREKTRAVQKVYYEKHKEELKAKAKIRYMKRQKIKGV